MKHTTLFLSGLFLAATAVGQHDHDDLATEQEHAEHEHAAEVVAHDHDGEGVADHGGADAHGEDEQGGNEHAGHDHGPVEGIKFAREMFEKGGIKVAVAEAGTIVQTAIFPAEIKLNRDTTVSVSPRYASVVRKTYAEIGDAVQKGDALATLENRETMATYTVTAPRDGVVISKDLAPGEIASVEKAMFQIADLSSVWADISIFPRYQHMLKKGAAVTFVAHDGHTAKGTVKYISPIIDHETRVFTARCVLKGAPDDFTPGAFVRARITVATAKAGVVVPRAAVQVMEGESVVFTPSPNGFVPALVTLGLADDAHVEIKSGLAPGAKYVAVGAFSLKAQMVTSGMDPHAGHGH